MSFKPTNKVPSLVFIIPYRDRPEQKFVFEKYMNYILEDYKKSDYAIFFVEQKDERPFNRGALKNIGFLALKKKYPNHYQKITFVFNDIDTFPYKKGILNYKTEQGKIKHFFGFEYTLGGIFSITGADFEKIGGFPNFWTWGYEDNIIYNKAVKISDIHVDRSVFFKVFDHNIVHMTDSLKRTINVKQLTSRDMQAELYNNLTSVNNIKHSFIANKIVVSCFDINLPYTENIQIRNINITDDPRNIQKMKLRIHNNQKGISRNMNFFN